MASLPPPDKASIDLRHPTPDVQSLQGAGVGHIERLEEHAERMSEAGSDLGDEIRRLHAELKRSASRSSCQPGSRSRNVSVSSHANSIVDVNAAARWGGYSPAAYHVTSPPGSLRSGSWSAPSPSGQRQRSESKASRLGHAVHPDEIEIAGAAHSSARRVSSFTRKYDDIANELRDELRNTVSFTRKSDDIANELRDELRNTVSFTRKSDDIANTAILDHPAHHGEDQHGPDRPSTAASTDTSRQARTLWHDFDGVHCPDTVPEEAPTPTRSTHARHASHGSMLRLPSDQQPQPGAPPPSDDMVFYPAPVPRMLNLPKRLSQLPPSHVQARRRTQVLDHIATENRKSAPFVGDMAGEDSKPSRKSRQSMFALPPQLRASAYFDGQAAPAQEYAVQGESAKDTLDSILDASASAPVSAFTDHPFAGNAGPGIYGPEHKRKSSKLPEIPPTLAETRRRSSFMMLDTKRNSSGDPLNKLRKRNSSADMNLLLLKASESRMSLGGELDEHDEQSQGPQNPDDDHAAARSLDQVEGRNPDDVYEDEHMDDEPEAEEAEEPQYFGAPTTLLAELQLRKAKQKTRNMNYATLVEQGNMSTHRTLLQLDDIAEKEKQKRIKKKVNLAWEAHAEDDSDDDVPLGVLYKSKPQPDFERPLGLIAQRQLEDQEPLSRRRTRLLGDSPGLPGLGHSPSQLHLGVPTTTTPGPETDEDDGETLGERMRRLREKKEIDVALGHDLRKSTISLDFATEMMSKFGVTDDPKTTAPQPTPSSGAPDEEETLGQRRARLQAEAAARESSRPALRQSLSMADVLSANPIDVHNQARKVSDQQLISHLPQGSLLQQNVVAEERRKAQRQLQNARASSYGAFDPLIAQQKEKNDDDTPLGVKIQAYKNRMNGVPDQRAQSMAFNPNMPMMPMGMMSQPNLNMMGGMPMPGMQNPMMQNPMMMQNQMMGMPINPMQQQHQQQQQLIQMQMMQMGMNMNGVGMMMPPMDPRQRENIDRWMSGIQH